MELLDFLSSLKASLKAKRKNFKPVKVYIYIKNINTINIIKNELSNSRGVYGFFSHKK